MAVQELDKTIARRKARGMGLFGCGIGTLIFAYYYLSTIPKEGTVPAWAPPALVAVGVLLMLIGGVMTRSAIQASKGTASK